MLNLPLSRQEAIRYARHLALPEFGREKQEMLKNARVLVIGAGGLGAPVLQYLSAAGVGHIGIVDFDKVDESNLQRQVLFSVEDIGKQKAVVAMEKLRLQNPHIQLEAHVQRLDSSNALALFKDYDLIIDGTDNFPSRYLINDASVLLGKPLVYASIYQFEGQVSVFNYNNGPNYRDLFPTPPPPGMVPNCAEGGVLGVLPGIIGSIQALEAIKVVADLGDVLSGRLFLLDTLTFTTRSVKIPKDPSNPISGRSPSIHSLIDYEAFCRVDSAKDIQEISVHELKQLIESNHALHLIDVREPMEYEAGHLIAKNLPLSTIQKQKDEIPSEGTIVFYCKSGRRSADAIKKLTSHSNKNSFLNLKGGILAWKEAFNSDLEVI